MKDLRDMSLAELWQLFPIALVPHDVRWSEWAREEIGLLTDILSDVSPTITHIGSTAIHGIYAKPIVDILVEIPERIDMARIRVMMEMAGYICMNEQPDRLSFNKGYTPAGYADRVFHIHVHRTGDNAEIAFRDYLRTHPDAAREYEQLKLSLLAAYRHDRDAYTRAKTDFVAGIVRLANRL